MDTSTISFGLDLFITFSHWGDKLKVEETPMVVVVQILALFDMG